MDTQDGKEVSWRFINLCIFLFQHVICGSNLTLIASIASIVQEHFKIKIEVIQYCSSLVVFTVTIVTLFNIFILNKIGLKIANLICTFFLILGVVAKFFINYGQIYLIISSVIQGISFAYILNTHMLFFKNWFLPKNIIHYFPFVASAVFVGNGFGAILPFFFIDESETDTTVLLKQYI